MVGRKASFYVRHSIDNENSVLLGLSSLLCQCTVSSGKVRFQGISTESMYNTSHAKKH
jgi:hypothetical protein